MQIDLPNFVQTELNAVISSTPEKRCENYMSAFKQRQSELQEQDNEQFALGFGLLTEVCSMWLDPDNKDEPLQPFWNNGDWTSATPQSIQDEFIEVLVTLLPLLIDPELVARVADILWLRKRDYHAGKQAISAYLDSARSLEGTEHWIVFSLQRLERALQLARRLNDNEGIQNAVNYLADTLDKYKGDVSVGAGIPVHLLSLIQKYQLMPARADEFADLAEAGARGAETSQIWHIAQSYWDLKAKWNRAEGKEDDAKNALIAAAEIDVTQAQLAAAEDPPRYLAAARFVEEAIVALRRIGGQQSRVDELQKLLIHYGQESLGQMEKFSFSVDTTPFVQQARKAVSGRDLEQALTTWAYLTNVPTVDALRQDAQRNISQNPLRFLVSGRTLNRLGKTVARQNGDIESDETVAVEMLNLATLYQEAITGSIIQPALYQINLEHNIRGSDLLPILNHNPFVPPGHEQIYARGLAAGLRDDVLVSTHILLPQLEASLREILTLTGKITSGLDNDLIQDEYPLSAIIYWRELIDVLGEDIVFNLRTLLVERQGSNLRNLAAHGLMQFNEFYSPRVTFLTWISLRLLLTPIMQITPDEDNESNEG